MSEQQPDDDGLGSLKDRRRKATERRRRQAPPSRNPRPPGAEPEPPTQEGTPAEKPDTTATPPPPPDPPKPDPKPEPPQDKGTSRTGHLRLAQFYVDPEIDRYLRKVRALALLRGIDVSGSAVAREALRMLMDRATPEQIVDAVELSQATEKPGKRGKGRPRR